MEDKNDDIQIIEEEEEEVLVDDFDGQCCRTFPYNHSKIQRWREERRRRDEERRAKEPRKEEAKQVKVPTSSTETSATSGKPGEPVTTTAGETQWRVETHILNCQCYVSNLICRNLYTKYFGREFMRL